MRLVGLAGLCASWLLGCSVEEIDLTGKQCPCAAGWVCDEARNSCVRSLGAGGGATGGAAGAGGSGGGEAGSGGSGAIGGGATGGGGGGPTGSVGCGSTSCTLPAQVCCHDPMASNPQGQCVTASDACTGRKMSCDDAADCGGAPNVCCVELDPAGEVKKAVGCRASQAACATSGNGSVELLCDPSASTPCPAGLSCKTALKMVGYWSCQP